MPVRAIRRMRHRWNCLSAFRPAWVPQFVAVGRDALGRLLTVAYTYREPDAIRIISARPATKKERQAYET
jgi:uncharacterized DUF497 family protein